MLGVVDVADLLSEMLKSSPTAAALLVVVILFIRYLRDCRAAELERDKADRKAMEAMGVRCHEFQRAVHLQTTEVIGRCSEALDANTAALGRSGAIMDRLERRLGA